MKQIFRVFMLPALVLMLGFQTVNACSLNILPLRKEFRKSKLVFLGKITNIEDYYVPTEQEKHYIPEIWQKDFTEIKNKSIFSKVTFEIKKEWKGNLPKNKDFVAVAYWGCGCPGEYDEFKLGEEYIIFSDNKNFVMVCDSFRQKIMNKTKLLKRLNEFWFRAWARVYPF